MKIAAAARRPRHLAIVALAGLIVMAGSTACEPARVSQKDRPIIFVHGWSALGNGNDCQGNFGPLQANLRSRGFTGQFVTIAFYDSDRNCDVSLADWASISNSTSWKDLSKALSKYIYTTYTSKGIVVDLVGHSMGGLITRGAVYGSAHGDSGFSAPIKAEDSVTLAAPHNGAAWYSVGCLWGQCSGLKPGAADLDWLNQEGNPQGPGGTEWTVLGSTQDDVVPDESATYMFLPDNRKAVYGDLEHSDYMSNATAQARTAQALADPNA